MKDDEVVPVTTIFVDTSEEHVLRAAKELESVAAEIRVLAVGGRSERTILELADAAGYATCVLLAHAPKAEGPVAFEFRDSRGQLSSGGVEVDWDDEVAGDGKDGPGVDD